MVEHSDAYLPLDEEQAQTFQEMMLEACYQGGRDMNQTSFEKGLTEGRVEMLCDALEEKFGEVSAEVRAMFRKILTADSLTELELPE